MTDLPLLEIADLTVTYRGRRRSSVTALDDVSLRIGAGETVGLVGESGSGKSTLANAILGLAPVASGRIAFEGRDVTNATAKERRALSSDLQIVFQDPYGSLNPSRTIGQTLSEPMLVHRKFSASDARERAVAMLRRVGLPADATDHHPDHFSGGQRQRVAIARALMLEPRLVICDEPVSGLDLSVQAQVLNLLRHLQREMSLSYLFISHDLDVVRHVCHRVVVLYRGQIVEQGPTRRVYEEPLHPYTRTLLTAAPIPDPVVQARRRSDRQSLVTGRPPVTNGVSSTGPGCPFAPQCPHVMDVCTTIRPPLKPTEISTDVACHWHQESEPVSRRKLLPA